MGTSAGVAPSGRDKVLYYALGLTPPVDHADWVRRDVGRRAWKLRRGFQFAAGTVLGGLLAGVFLELSPGLILGAITGAAIGAVLQMTLMQDYVCRRALAYYEKRWSKQRSE